MSTIQVKRSIRQTLVQVILAFGFLGAIVFIERDLIAAHLWREDARQELVDVFRTIPDSATRADVARILPSGDDTFLSVTKLEREWLVSTPLMFGARNWIMWIEFDSDAVVALRIRTHDSRDEHPPNAPGDRIFLHKDSSSSNSALQRPAPGFRSQTYQAVEQRLRQRGRCAAAERECSADSKEVT